MEVKTKLNQSRLIDAFYKVCGLLILCMHGNPGMGKTSSALAYCKRNNIPYFYLPANKASLDQMSGAMVMSGNKKFWIILVKFILNFVVSIVNIFTKKGAEALKVKIEEVEIKKLKEAADEDSVKIAPPEFVKFLNEHPDGMLIIDELGTADKVKQGLLLSIILDCKGFGWEFPKTVRRICMTNDSFQSTGNNTLISALNDRVCHVWADGTFIENIPDWRNSYEIFPEADVADKSTAMKYHVQNMELIIDFMMSFPKYQERYGNEDRIQELEDEKAKMTSYLSKRTLSNLNLVLDYFSGMLTKEENEEFGVESGMKFLHNIIAGYCGEDFATDFMQFVVGKFDNRFEFDPQKFENKEDKFTLDMVINPDQNDQVALIVRSMWMYFNADPIRWSKLWVRVLNLTYNYEKKYGNYTGYASYSIQYINPTIQIETQKLGTRDLPKLHNDFEAYAHGSDEIKQAIGMKRI